MNEILRHLQQLQTWFQDLHLNPWAVAIGAGLVAAFLEQRIAHRHAPPFTAAHRGGAASPPPEAPPLAKPRR
jgi:hypothetical protein